MKAQLPIFAILIIAVLASPSLDVETRGNDFQKAPTTGPSLQKAKGADEKVIRSAFDVIADLPKDLRFTTTAGWDPKFQSPMVLQWLNANLIGQKVEAPARITGISMEPAGVYDAQPWRIRITVAATLKNGMFAGLRLASDIQVRNGLDIVPIQGVFHVSEATKKTWEKKREALERRPLDGTITGTIAAVRIDVNNTRNGYDFHIEVAQPAMSISGVGDDRITRVPGANVAPARPVPLEITFKAMSEVLSKLPKELQPTTDDGWDKFTLPKVREWLTANVVGSKFEAEAYLLGIAVDPVAGADSDHNWRVAVAVGANIKSATMNGIVLSSSITGPAWATKLEWDVNEATARVWQKKSDAIKQALAGAGKLNLIKPDGIVRGTSSSITVTPVGGNETSHLSEYRISFHIEDMEIEIAGLTKISGPRPVAVAQEFPQRRIGARTPDTKVAATAAAPPDITFKAMNEVFGKLPKELRPTADDGWDKFTLPKVREWLAAKVVGAKIEAEIYAQGITVDPVEGAGAGHRWRIAMDAGANIGTVTMDGVVFNSSVRGRTWLGKVECRVDEATAKVWQKKSDVMKRALVDGGKNPTKPDGLVSGTISSVSITPVGGLS